MATDRKPSAKGPGPGSASPIRVAAAGDIHIRRDNAEGVEAAFAALDPGLDLVLLAGDLTADGEVEEAELLAAACAPIAPKVVAVLGNHDHHHGCAEEIAATLRAAGATVLERDSVRHDSEAGAVGIVGVKGFVGGFTGSRLPDFGEPLLRRLYAETTRDVEALEEGLRAIATCPFRIVLLHYAPTAGTLVGEPEGIWTMLGNDRIAAPILEHQPDVVLHGHAHVGSFEAAIGATPVYNVAVPVLGSDFWTLELSPHLSEAIH